MTPSPPPENVKQSERDDALAVVRRLRTDAASGDGTGDAQLDVIAAGRAPGDFAVLDTDGQPLTRADLRGEVLVGFFSTLCRACVEALPGFVATAGAFPGGRDRVVAVVEGDQPQADRLAARLAGAARVVVEEPDGAMGVAFQVAAYPAWCLLRDGTVRDSGTGTGSLRLPGAARA